MQERNPICLDGLQQPGLCWLVLTRQRRIHMRDHELSILSDLSETVREPRPRIADSSPTYPQRTVITLDVEYSHPGSRLRGVFLTKYGMNMMGL
jgi:hypothetical protein